MSSPVQCRCGISAGRSGKRCGTLLEVSMPNLRVFAAGYVDPGDSPYIMGRCPRHDLWLYGLEQEIQEAAEAGRKVVHFWRLLPRSGRLAHRPTGA